MPSATFNDLLILRVTKEQGAVDFLFITTQDLLSVNTPRDISDRIRIGSIRHDRAILSEGPDAFSNIFGDRWSSAGLIAPTAEELSRLPTMQFQSWFEHRLPAALWSAFEPYKRNELTRAVITISEKHLDWLPGESGWVAFLDVVKNPEKHKLQQIGAGSEGKVYKLTWEGRVCALKIVDPMAQQKMAELGTMFRVIHPEPNFLHKIGYSNFAGTLFESLDDIAFDAKFVEDYAYGQSFHLTEHVESAITLADFFPTQHGKEPSEESKAFSAKEDVHGEDLVRLRESWEAYNRAMNFARFRPPFFGLNVVHDPHPSNVLVESFDSRTRRFRLTFLDQCNTPGYSNDPIHRDFDSQDDTEATRKLFESAQGDPRLQRFYKKYFADGFPF